MLKGGLVSIWELDMNLVPTLLLTYRKIRKKIFMVLRDLLIS